MNRKLATYGIAFCVALVTMIALAPTSSAEHCWEVGVEEDEATAKYDNCQGVVVEANPDEGVATTEHHCWYVIVPEQQVGPASVAVWQCDPQISIDEDWTPKEEIPLEHCISIGAQAGPVWYDHNPCNEDARIEDDNPDRVAIFLGYNTIEVVDGPL
jgi:hypothetical protein